jgi:hypothetical protein
VVDLSSPSDEEYLIVHVSRDEEFTRRLFGDLNRDILGPPDDDKIIISATPKKKKKKRACVRRRPPTLKLRHLLLQGPRPQSPLLPTSMEPTRVIPLIG